jgi:hypothetical protein
MDPVQAAIAGELHLLEPRVRASAELLEPLLDPGFSEIGASGQVWRRSAIIAALTAIPEASQPALSASELSGALVAPGVVHLTFVTVDSSRRVHRSSLWRLTDDGWRIYFHQGTPAPVD